MGEMFPQVEVIPGRGKGSADYRPLTTMGLADYRRAGNSEGYPPEGRLCCRSAGLLACFRPNVGDGEEPEDRKE